MPPVPRRGELRISVPIGYVWHREIGLGFDPDLRIQEVVRLTFARFRQLGCARQVQLGYPAPWQQFSPKRLIGWPLAMRSINLGEVHLGIEAVELGALQHGVINKRARSARRRPRNPGTGRTCGATRARQRCCRWTADCRRHRLGRAQGREICSRSSVGLPLC